MKVYWEPGFGLIRYVYEEATEMLQTIANIQMLHKLSDKRDRWDYPSYQCNGLELCRRLEPSEAGDAQRWLNKRGEAIHVLTTLHLVEQTARTGGPYGYGCDVLFNLTALGLEFLKCYPDADVLAHRLATLHSYR
jgi:hypothetical protein